MPVGAVPSNLGVFDPMVPRLVALAMVAVVLAGCAKRGTVLAPLALSSPEISALVSGNTEFGELILPADKGIEGPAGRSYMAYYAPDGRMVYKLVRAKPVEWRWRVTDNPPELCCGPSADKTWCRAVQAYGDNLYKAIEHDSRDHQYSFSILEGDARGLGAGR